MNRDEPIRFRPTRESDLDWVLKAEQNEENTPYITCWSREQHRHTWNDPDKRHWVVEDRQTGSKVGFIILAGLNNPHESVELLRIVITRKQNGYGKHALRLVQRYVFEDRQAHRLWLDVKEYNPRARHVYRSLGFIEEGLLRECWKNGDRRESLVLMSQLRPEYLANKRRRFPPS